MYFLCAGVIFFKHFPLACAFAKKKTTKKNAKQWRSYTRAHKGLGPGNLKVKVKIFFCALCGIIGASASTRAIPVPGQYPGTPLT